MTRFFRWFNQNRETFIAIIIAVAFIIIVIQILNGIARKRNEEIRNEMSNRNSSTNSSTTISPTDTSIMTGEPIKKNDNVTNTDIIKKFIEYCNNKKIQEAYNMLTDECKELLYPDLNTFKTNYIDRIFYITRMYGLENWYDSEGFFTYYIKYTEDVLATGSTNSRR